MSIHRVYLFAALAFPAIALAGPPDPDATRIGSTEAKANDAVLDELSTTKGDLVDWKRIRLDGKAGDAVFQVNWDEPAADVGIELFDEEGTALAPSPKRIALDTQKRIAMRVEPGVYFVRLTALTGNTVYTFRCRWNGTPAPIPSADDPGHPRCKIVQTYRDDDGGIVLYLDKGTAAGLSAGMLGQVLKGADDVALEGADFKVSRVIDTTHAIGKIPVGGKAVGKNTRCVIHLVSAP
jgi:hypothetical protein